jgi:hypothetical protein
MTARDRSRDELYTEQENAQADELASWIGNLFNTM